MSADLTNPVFTDEDAAMAHLEASRWPDGPNCPHCGSVNVHRMAGKTQAGMFQCNDCRGKFTARVGTVMERSHVPVHKWLLAIHLMTSSKKGMSAHQLHRMLGVTYKTAWFMAHRIREAMREGELSPMGGSDGVHGVVEADETFIGREPGRKKKRGYAHKMKVLSLVDRENGKVRSMVVDDLKAETLVPILQENIAKEASVMTDDAGQYGSLGEKFIEHQSVNHSQEEYARGIVHTNTVEGYFSVFKRGMKGICQHCAKHHLHRYLAESDFRYNHRIALGISDKERAAIALKGIEGKRLTYRRPDEAFV